MKPGNKHAGEVHDEIQRREMPMVMRSRPFSARGFDETVSDPTMRHSLLANVNLTNGV